MRLAEIIDILQHMEGNYHRKTGDIYISPINMIKFIDIINNCVSFPSILVTPFLINPKNDNLYELHYYEFEIEVEDVQNSYYINHLDGNTLAKEITNNIKPKAVASSKDSIFAIYALKSYIEAMNKMRFDNEKQLVPVLNDANLYYQVY